MVDQMIAISKDRRKPAYSLLRLFHKSHNDRFTQLGRNMLDRNNLRNKLQAAADPASGKLNGLFRSDASRCH